MGLFDAIEVIIEAVEAADEDPDAKEVSHGHLEGGRLGLLKNFKTPFFGRYSKFLP